MGSPTPGTGTTFGQQALAFAQTYINNGVDFGVGACLAFVRSAYGFATDPVTPRSGSVPTAADAWAETPAAERHTDANPPAGVPVYWTGGSSGAGHVAISEGNGMVASTDFGPSGYVGDGRVRSVALSSIAQHDPNLRYAGWSPDLGDTPASSGTYGTVYDTPGTGMTTTTGTAPSSSGGGLSLSGIAGSLLSPFTSLFAAAGKGLLRVGLILAGSVVLLFALHQLGSGSGG